MDLSALKPGDRLRTVDGDIVQVVAPSEDGRWVRVTYVQSAGDPHLVGTEDLCAEDELCEPVNGHALNAEFKD